LVTSNGRTKGEKYGWFQKLKEPTGETMVREEDRQQRDLQPKGKKRFRSLKTPFLKDFSAC